MTMTMTSDLGGSYAISGFIFQFLNSMDRGLSASLTLGGGGERVLVLEPPHADAIEAGDAPRVVQYKRRTGRAWSNHQILFDILPNLLRACVAAGPSTLRPVFVTSGRLQHGAALRAFLAGYADAARSDELRVGRRMMSADAVLQEISARMGAVLSRMESDRQAVIRRLLSRVTIEEGVSSAAVRARILDVLLRATGTRRRAKVAYEALFTFIVTQSENAATSISAEAFLEAAGLTPEVLIPILEFDKRAAASTRAILDRRGYEPSRDVRGAPTLPDATIVLLVAGSGTGKTWQLAAIAEQAVRRNELVVWLDRPTGVTEASAQIVEHVWHRILQRDDETNIQTLLAQAALVLGRERPPALVLLVDQLPADPHERAALLRYDWAAAGMRLVAAATDDQAAEAQEQFPVPSVRLGDFTQSQLRDLLGRYGLRWASVPADVRRWISRPILSGLYVSLREGSGSWSGDSEYELLEQLALRAQRRLGASGESGARRILADLGGQLLVTGRLEPAALADRPTAQQLALLSSAGWLAQDARDTLIFGHDRLRDWAVAEHLSRAAIAAPVLAEQLARITGYLPSNPPQTVLAPYALMDTLWLISRGEDGARRLTELLDAFDADPALWQLCDDLYRELLPTGGAAFLDCLLEPLIARLGDTRQESGGWRAAACVEAFAKAGAVSSQAIGRLLRANVPAAQRCACVVLARHPEARQLEALARLHWQAHGNAGAGQEKDGALAQAAWTALRECIEHSPTWLSRYFERKLNQDQGPEHLLSLLTHVPCGRAIWDMHGAALVARHASDPAHRYWLAKAIERFCDRRFDAELEAWCRDRQGMAALPAWTALCRDRPERVPDLVSQLPDGLLSVNVGAWIAPLITLPSRASLDAVIETLKGRDPSGCTFAFVLSWHSAALRDDDIRWAADRLSEALLPRPDRDLTASRLLDFFAHINEPGLIARLPELVPPPLPERLIGHIRGRLTNAGLWHDSELVGADTVLRHLGPAFAAAALRMRLTHPNSTLRWNAVREAGLVDFDRIRSELEAIADAPEERDEPGRLDAVMMLAERDPAWGHARIRRLAGSSDRSAINEAFWIALRMPGDDYVADAAALLPDCFADAQVLYRVMEYLTSRRSAPAGAESVLEEALASHPDEAGWIIDSLLALRTAEADQVVLDHLASEQNGLTVANLGFWGAVNRPADGRWVKVAEDAVASRSTIGLRHTRFFYRYAARSTGPAYDQLLSDAYPTRAGEFSRTLSAISALAETDALLAMDAMTAFCRHFDADSRDVETFAKEVGHWRFAGRHLALFNGAFHWPAPALLRALASDGGAYDPRLVKAVEKALMSTAVEERRAAAICSPLILNQPPSPALLRDPDRAVREAADYALRWHEGRVRALALLDTMSTGTPDRARQAAAALLAIWEAQKTSKDAPSFSRAEFLAKAAYGSGLRQAITA